MPPKSQPAQGHGPSQPTPGPSQVPPGSSQVTLGPPSKKKPPKKKGAQKQPPQKQIAQGSIPSIQGPKKPNPNKQNSQNKPPGKHTPNRQPGNVQTPPLTKRSGKRPAPANSPEEQPLSRQILAQQFTREQVHRDQALQLQALETQIGEARALLARLMEQTLLLESDSTLRDSKSEHLEEVIMETQPWCLYPDRHDEVAALLCESNLSFTFHEEDDDDEVIKEWESKIRGTFKCDNGKCFSQKSWPSGHIGVSIRMFENREYNARVYNQRCGKCERVCVPTLDHTYAERVARRLKVWCGVRVPRAPSPVIATPEHLTHLCEGCRIGRCKMLDAYRT